MRKIRAGDTVLVIKGRNKGQQGTVRRNLTDQGRVVVEGVNIVKKHIKRRPGVRQAGIVEVEAPLNVANVMVVCPSCGEASRIGVRKDAEGKNERFCKKCETALPRRSE